ncbi:MAG: hypothetical protein ABSH56_28180 [Bryobacteraceae bacterium]|jgi:hypothetical protein
MRRTLASILVALFSFPLIAPLLADTDSTLPACCRRNGKHHCSMMSMGSPSPGLAVRTIQPKCPCYPAANTVPAKPNVALLSISPAVFALLFSRPAGQVRTTAGYRITLSRSRHVRGPPPSLS